MLDEAIDIDIEEALTEGRLDEELPDDRIYFVNKFFYHTEKNVSIKHENIHKVGAGPEGKGKAGDIDVGYIEVPSGKIRRIELKSPGRIPAKEARRPDRSYDPVKHAEKQNSYMADLIDAFEENEGWEIPYSPRVEVWNDVVDSSVILDEVPKYSQSGGYVASSNAVDRAEASDKIQAIDEAFFKGWMLGGGEDIIEEMDF